MERKQFLKICGGACLGLVGVSLALQSCGAAYYAQATMNNGVLQVSKSQFQKIQNDKIKYRRYILLEPQDLDYPIVVFRNDESSYTALFMRCTHQGNELAVNGDILTCSAHGSEFAKTGDVLQGPADERLKSFPVTSDDTHIYIQLT